MIPQSLRLGQPHLSSLPQPCEPDNKSGTGTGTTAAPPGTLDKSSELSVSVVNY